MPRFSSLDHFIQSQLLIPQSTDSQPSLSLQVLLGLLWSQKLINIDQLRRGIEYLEPEAYANWSYYGRWAASITRILIENGVITQKEIDDELGPTESEEEIKFNVGDRVTVKPESTKSRWRKPHLRVPGYIFNCTGTIERVAGVFPNPEVGAFQTQHSIMAPLYRVRFAMRDVWPENPNSAEIGDTTIDVEIYQHWLEPARETSAGHAATPSRSDASHSHGDHDHDHDHSDSAHSHSHSHSHSADHGHTHEARTIVEQNAVDKEGPPSAEQHLAASLINLCISKKIITREQLRRTIDALDTAAASDAIGPKLVARAWVDPEFKKRLLEDAVSAAKELGLRANSGPEPEMVAVANEPGIHNVIVCTLCSCYPRAVLGFAPEWVPRIHLVQRGC